MGRSQREEKKPCCTWPRILVLVVVLIAGGVCLWKFGPWEDTINDVLDSIPIPGGSDGKIPPLNDDYIPQTLTPVSGATASPTAAPPDYDFMQCNSDGTTTPSNCCNGLEGLCDLRVNEVMYATLHNAMATFENGFLFGPNHKFQLEGALEAGYRGLNLDICNCGGELQFCHGICALGPREIVDVMQSVNTFLDENPTEVIIFIYQVNDDVDQEVDLNKFYDQLLLVDGLVDKLYVHPDIEAPWPTLGEITDPEFNKRIVMFHYGGPNCSIDPLACPDGLHLYYEYGSDNDWEHSGMESIRDRVNSCELGLNGFNKRDFVGLNNFVSPPSQSTAAKANEYSEVLDYVNTCSVLLETDINFVLIDFWSVGDLPRATQDHNAALIERRRRQLQRERGLLRAE